MNEEEERIGEGRIDKEEDIGMKRRGRGEEEEQKEREEEEKSIV